MLLASFQSHGLPWYLPGIMALACFVFASYLVCTGKKLGQSMRSNEQAIPLLLMVVGCLLIAMGVACCMAFSIELRTAFPLHLS